MRKDCGKFLTFVLTVAMVLCFSSAALAEERGSVSEADSSTALVESDTAEGALVSLDDENSSEIASTDEASSEEKDSVASDESELLADDEPQDSEVVVGSDDVLLAEDEGAAAEEEVGASAKKSLPIGSWCSYGIYFYTGEPIPLDYSTNLVYGRDYTVSYKNNVNPGTATATFTGKGSYAGAEPRTIEYTIDKASISKATVSGVKLRRWTGKPVCPKPKVEMDGRTLVEGTDYTLGYENNTDMGTATMILKGIGGYQDTTRRSFQIKGDIANAVVPPIDDMEITNLAIRPKPIVVFCNEKLVLNKDYTLTYKNNKDIGTATVIITGKGNYAGSKSAEFRITQRKLENMSIISPEPQTYTGKPLTPNVHVEHKGYVLVRNSEYTLSYENNTDPGIATVTISGDGSWCEGSVTTTFTIVRASINKAQVSAVASQPYTGNPITPKPTVTANGRTLVYGKDYTLTYKNNTKPGTATITVVGKGGYKDSKDFTFQITKGKISSAVITGVSNKAYTGKEIHPVPTVKVNGRTLVAGEDYKVTYANCTNPGTATMTVTGMDCYTGSKSVPFTISRLDLSTAVVSCTYYVPKFTGSAVKLNNLVVVCNGRTLALNTDFAVYYSSNTKPGTATATIAGRGGYTGTYKIKYKIAKASIQEAKITGIQNATYTGQAIKPRVTVTYGGKTLKLGTDYKVTYENNVQPGYATVTITGIGDSFTGMRKETFRISKA